MTPRPDPTLHAKFSAELAELQARLPMTLQEFLRAQADAFREEERLRTAVRTQGYDVDLYAAHDVARSRLDDLLAVERQYLELACLMGQVEETRPRRAA